MKELLILRHAKSSWKEEGISDHERPLNKRGERDAPQVGQLVLAQNLVPGLILSSTAVRARETARKVAKNCGYDGEIQQHSEIYDSGPPWLGLLQDVPDDVSRVMMVGHNPGLEIFVGMLTGEEEELPTAALVHIKLPIGSWQEMGRDTRGDLVNIWRPKER